MPPLTLFRVNVKRPMTLTDMRLLGLPDLLEGVVARGHLDEDNEPISMIVFERATEWNDLIDATKEQLERTQVDRFLRDFKLAVGQPFASDVSRGDDPPDFSIMLTGGRVVGLECTQLVYGERIQAWHAIERLKSGLVLRHAGRFRHLRGRTVFVTSATDDGQLPRGQTGVDALANALDRFQPAANDFGEPPQNLEGTNIVQNIGDFILTAAGLSSEKRDSFVKAFGFDLALSVQTDVLASEAWTTLANRVHEKDIPGSEIVLVSCGAPVVKGLSFPADDLAAEAIEATASTNGVSATKHIRAIYIHRWRAERVIRLTPGRGGLDSLTIP